MNPLISRISEQAGKSAKDFRDEKEKKEAGSITGMADFSRRVSFLLISWFKNKCLNIEM